MEIRVQFPRERIRPAGSGGVARPQTDRQVDPGGSAGDRREDGGHGRQPADSDIGGHVDKTA